MNKSEFSREIAEIMQILESGEERQKMERNIEVILKHVYQEGFEDGQM